MIIKNHWIYIFFLLLSIPNFLLFSQETIQKKSIQAEEFLKMPLDKAFPIISKFNKEEAAELATQIRQIARASYPDIDKFYFLIAHLEEIQAIEKEQKRLESLLWVYALGYLLVFGFIFYVFISQRKLIRELQRNTK